MAAFTFDGPNKLAIGARAPSGGEVTSTAEELYAEYALWLAADPDNSRFEPMFETGLGGEEMSPGLFVGFTYLIQNGWKIRPYEAQHVWRITGNLVGLGGAEITTPTLGGFAVALPTQFTNLAQAVSTGGTVAPTEAQMRAAIWGASTSGWVSGTFGGLLRKALTVGKFLGLK